MIEEQGDGQFRGCCLSCYWPKASKRPGFGGGAHKRDRVARVVRGVALGGGWHYNHVMTKPAKQSKPQEQPQPSDAIREATEYGIDISMLRANLALRPAERLRRHQIALDRMRLLQKARFL